MKIADINKILTEKVSEYIAKGYIINTETMSGHQGEIGKVDLIKGKELIRVWLNSEYNKWDDPSGWYGKMAVLRVSKWEYEYDSRYERTVWMDNLITLEEVTFYKLDYSNWYVEDIATAIECSDKNSDRRRAKRERDRATVTDITSEDTIEVAVNYLKSHEGYQRVQRHRVKVFRRVYEDQSRQYLIQYNENQVYSLK